LDRARDAGADAILIKPVTPDVLLSEINRLLGRSPRTAEKSAAPE
jgi:DNA-binding response OmpR family regulator